jgi:hypothetical protein
MRARLDFQAALDCASDDGGSEVGSYARSWIPPSSTSAHPQLRPYPTQIGVLCHCRASNQSLTIRLTSSDTPAFQTGSEIAAGTLLQSSDTPLSFVIQPIRDDLSPRADPRSLWTFFRAYDSWQISSTLPWCGTSCLMNPSPQQVLICTWPHSDACSNIPKL